MCRELPWGPAGTAPPLPAWDGSSASQLARCQDGFPGAEPTLGASDPSGALCLGPRLKPWHRDGRGEQWVPHAPTVLWGGFALSAEVKRGGKGTGCPRSILSCARAFPRILGSRCRSLPVLFSRSPTTGTGGDLLLNQTSCRGEAEIAPGWRQELTSDRSPTALAFLRKLSDANSALIMSREAMSQGGFWASTAMRGTARAGVELAFPSPPRFLSFLPCKEMGPKKQNTPEC